MPNNPDAAKNLKPFTGADDPRRSNGRPKGLKNWSTVVQELLADEELLDKLYKRKPDWIESLPSKNAGHAIVAAMSMKALAGDKGAAEWLRKTGFGDKLDLTSDGERIEMTPIVISQIQARKEDDTATEQSDNA